MSFLFAGGGEYLQTLPQFKKGDTFAFIATIKDAAGTPITDALAGLKAQVRSDKGYLWAELVVSTTETPGDYLFKAADTSAWPVDVTLQTDIQYTDGLGTITSSETIAIPVVRGVTG